MIRILLWEQKGFRGCSIFVYMHQIGKRINAVFAATAYYEPAAVAAPAMIAFGILTVNLSHLRLPARSEVYHPYLGILVPDRKLTVSCFRIHHKVPVGRHAGEGYTDGVGMYQGVYLRTDGAVGSIEGYPAQTVPKLVVLFGHLQGRGRTEIEPLAVGRE